MTEPMNLPTSYSYALGEHFIVSQCDTYGAVYGVYQVRARPRDGSPHLSQKVAEFRSRLFARRWCHERNMRLGFTADEAEGGGR